MTPATPVRRAARALLPFALLATAALLAADRDGWLPFGSWLAGCAALVLGWRRTAARSRIAAWELAGVAAVTALGAWFRLHDLYAVPYGFTIDEARVAKESADLLRAPAFLPFDTTALIHARQEYVRIPNLYLYFCGALQWLAGFGRAGVKAISVAPGIAAVPLLWTFARGVLPPAGALLAAAFLATSGWHVAASRWGWEQVLTTALTIALFACVRRALAERCLAAAARAGLVAGLSLFADEAARLAWGAGLLVVGIELAARRDRFHVEALGLFLLGTAVAALPLFVSWIQDPSLFGARVGELWIGPSLAAGDLGPLLRGLKAHLLMFHWAGDPNPRHNPGGGPMLHPLVGGAFAVGLALAVARWRRLDARLCLVWLGVGLLGGVLSLSDDLPHAYRTGFIAPVCCVIAAGGAHWLANRAARGSRLSAALPIAAVAAVALVGMGEAHALFVRAVESGAAWRASRRGAPARLVGDSLAARLPEGGVVYVDRRLRRVELELELARFAPRTRLGRAPTPATPGQTTVLWLADRSPEALALALADPAATPRVWVTQPDGELPPTLGLQVEEVRDPWGASVARLAIARPAGAAAACGLRGRVASGAAWASAPPTASADPLELAAGVTDAPEHGPPFEARAPGAAPGEMSAEWTGVLEIAQPDRYRLALESDGAAALYVDGALALDAWEGSGRRRAERALELARGRHALALRYQARAPGGGVSLAWAPRDQAWSLVPCELLRPSRAD
jgi:hypothetical protein